MRLLKKQYSRRGIGPWLPGWTRLILQRIFCEAWYLRAFAVGDGSIVARLERLASLREKDKSLLIGLEKDVMTFDAGAVLGKVGESSPQVLARMPGWVLEIRSYPGKVS